MKDKDGRMKVTTEVFGQIKFIKVNAWEEFFYNKIDEKRKQEMATLRSRLLLVSFQVFISWMTSPLIINAVFAWYVLTDNDLSAEKAFPVISLFNTL